MESKNEEKQTKSYKLGDNTKDSGMKKKRRHKKYLPIITVKTAPVKLLQLHASFMVRMVSIRWDYLGFASNHETRLLHLNIIDKNALARENNKRRESTLAPPSKDGMRWSSGEDSDTIVDVSKKRKREGRKQQGGRSLRTKAPTERQTDIKNGDVMVMNTLSSTDSEDIEEVATNAQNPLWNEDMEEDKSAPKPVESQSKTAPTSAVAPFSSALNMTVNVVFDSNGCPSMKHHASSYLIIPTVYEYNRLCSGQDSTDNFDASTSLMAMLGENRPFAMLANFPDHAHRVELTEALVAESLLSGNTNWINHLQSNLVIVNVPKQPPPSSSSSSSSIDPTDESTISLTNSNSKIIVVTEDTQSLFHKKKRSFEPFSTQIYKHRYDLWLQAQNLTLDTTKIANEIITRTQSTFEIKQLKLLAHIRFAQVHRIHHLQVVEPTPWEVTQKQKSAHKQSNHNHLYYNSSPSSLQRMPMRFLVGTNTAVHVYNLRTKKLEYSISFQQNIVKTYLQDAFLFVLTESDICVYSSYTSEKSGVSSPILLLWKHPLLRMRGMQILNTNKFVLEFGSQTSQNRFGINADGKTLQSDQFDLRMRLQNPNDPNKRPTTIFEESSPKNVLLFEWAQSTEMIISLVNKCHEFMLESNYSSARQLVFFALKIISMRKSQLYPFLRLLRKRAQKKFHSALALHSQDNPQVVV
ncbi:hypothetical protein RFI_16881, partial [Reticulomyxa filosa]